MQNNNINTKMINGRALHFVFKVADRTLTAKFYREILGMKVSKLCTLQLTFLLQLKVLLYNLRKCFGLVVLGK